MVVVQVLVKIVSFASGGRNGGFQLVRMKSNVGRLLVQLLCRAAKLKKSSRNTDVSVVLRFHDLLVLPLRLILSASPDDVIEEN